MTLKEKAKTYSFWVSLVSIALIIFRTVIEQFNLNISQNLVTSIITGVCGLLVLFGLISSPSKEKYKQIEEYQNQAEQIMKEQQSVLDTIKEDINKHMENFENMTIQEQIEYLKNKLAEANTQESAEETFAEVPAEVEANFETQEGNPVEQETEQVFEDIVTIEEEHPEILVQQDERDTQVCLSKEVVQEIKELILKIVEKL